MFLNQKSFNSFSQSNFVLKLEEKRSKNWKKKKTKNSYLRKTRQAWWRSLCKVSKAKHVLCISMNLTFFPSDLKFLNVFKALDFHLTLNSCFFLSWPLQEFQEHQNPPLVYLAEQEHRMSMGLGRQDPWNTSWSGSSWFCSTQSLRDVMWSNADGKPHVGNLPVPGAHKSQKLKGCILNGWPATPETLPFPVGFS